MPNVFRLLAAAALLCVLYSPASAQDYTFSEGDQLEISVYEHPEMNRVVPVASDGRIYYMFMGPVSVVGKRPEEVSRKIEAGIAKFVRTPHVSVAPLTFNARNYTILGAVYGQGTFALSPGMTLLDAIAGSGGFLTGDINGDTMEIADLRRAFVSRKGVGMLPIDFVALMKQFEASQNVVLQPGDYIFIPSMVSRQVYICGEVNRARSMIFTEGMSLMRLLAESGPTAKAELHYVLQVTTIKGNREVRVIDAAAILEGKKPDLILNPDDVIYVPDSPFNYIVDLFNLAKSSFIRSFTSLGVMKLFDASSNTLFGDLVR